MSSAICSWTRVNSASPAHGSRDGSVVATLRASDWKESATAVVGDREWVFSKRKGELTGRWAAEPEGAALEDRLAAYGTDGRFDVPVSVKLAAGRKMG